MNTEDIPYQIHCLDDNGNVKTKYIFSGESTPFSDENGVHVSQQIHPDDSIRTIKNKIIQVIGEQTVSYNEIYAFIQVHKRVDVMQIYQQYTNKGRTNFTKTHLLQLARNMNIAISEDDLAPYAETEHFQYETVTQLIDVVPGETTVKVPIGQKFTKQHDMMFPSNPYDIVDRDPLFQSTTKNHLVVFENMLLFNYGKPIDNVIYVCFAQDVLETLEHTISIYYPLLHQEDEISSKTELLQKQQELIKASKKRFDKDALVVYKSVDLFYDIFNKRTTDLKYTERGIKSYDILLKNNFQTKLPLETIFKNIHATKNTPFIKYNPGPMRENIYRLYVEKISRNGKKIPFLSENMIMQLSRKIGKRNQISMYIADTDVYMDFESTGNIRIYGECKTPILPTELSTLIQKSINPMIQNINKFLQQSGYALSLFNTIYDENVEVLDATYVAKMMIDNEVSLQKYMKCLSGLFIIQESNIAKTAKLVYKRVQNFHIMDAETVFMKQLYKKTNDANVIIQTIMETFQYDNQRAQKVFADYLQNMNVIDVESPGFPTTIHTEPLENQIIITIENIVHIEYMHLLHMYVDSFLRITQKPDTTNIEKSFIDSVCRTTSKITKDVDVTHIQNVIDVAPSTGIYEEQLNIVVDSPLMDQELDQEVDQEPGQDDDALFYDDDEDAGDSLFDGGSNTTIKTRVVGGEDDDAEPYKKELAGTSLHNPNLFEDRMKKREPYLFVTKSGKFTNYSTLCQSAAKKQPVILSQEEKDKIDAKDRDIGSKSYQHAIKYGTNPEKQNWYICPRYWCLQTNMSMTEEEVKAGKCGTKPYPDNIIPDGADVIPEGAYVVEFKSKKHVNKDGSYKHYNPGVLSHKTDDGYCIPCCYGEWKSGLWQKNKEKCPAQIDDDDDAQPTQLDEKGRRRRKAQTKKQENYVMGIDKFPISQGRWGLLPFSVQSFLHTDNSKCISKTNQVVTDPSIQCLLRHGVEKSDTQSFVACLAAMYAYKQNLESIPSIAEFKDILVNTITLDMFIAYNNASLVATFKPKRINIADIDLDKYSNTEFINTINMNDTVQVEFLEDTIASFENFLKFLKNDQVVIDHNYLWDLATQAHPNLMRDGYNLVILEIPKDDLRDNIQITCPTHSQSSLLYDPTKETVILIMQTNKQGTYFEPISMYAEENQEIKMAFTEQTSPQNLKQILSIIQKTTNKYCTPLPSMPKQYFFEKNKSASAILFELKSVNYEVNVQVLNYQGKVIGLYAILPQDKSIGIYIPCQPSSELPLLEKWWMEDDDLWTDYENTRNRLYAVHKNTNGKVLCKPMFKVLEDGMIVGILTETNQFVQISPISENIFPDDGLIEMDSHNYLVADKVIMTSQTPDIKRTETIRKIHQETQYYGLFRSIVRQTLQKYDNRALRQQITELLDYNNRTLSYREKLDNMIILLHKLIDNHVIFAKMDDQVLDDMSKMCSSQECAIFTEANMIYVPEKHLLSGMDNSVIYYARVADELLRYRRVQLFMLNPSSYLNIGDVDYSIYEDEMLMLQSLLMPEYFRDLFVFNENEYLKNIDYVNAMPAISQKYSTQPITLEEQRKIESIEKKPGELNMDCVQRIRDEVQGNERSLWKRSFPKPAREVVFYPTPACTFAMMIYIIENVNRARGGKVTVNITVQNIKTILWSAYKSYLDKPDYYEKISSILKNQGKKKFFVNGTTMEEIVMNDQYYLTDLDIWIIAQKLRLPIILFSSTSLKSLIDPTKKTDWLLLGGNFQTDKYYFVRSPSKIETTEYQLILPATELTNPSLHEFYSAVQMAVVAKQQGMFQDSVQTVEQYLEAYRYKTIVRVKPIRS